MPILFLALLPLLGGFSISTAVEPQKVNHEAVAGLVALGTPEISIQNWEESTLVAYTGLVNRKGGIYFRQFDRKRNQWSDAVGVSGHDAQLNFKPKLAIDSKGVRHLVWLSRLSRRKHVASYSRLTPGDSQWSAPLQLPAGQFDSEPQLAIDSKDRLYVYFRFREGLIQSGRIALHVSKDGGSSWQEANPNYPSEIKKGAASDPLMAGDDAGRAFMIWLDQTPGGKSVVFSVSDDGGKTWLREPVAVSDAKFAYAQPRMLLAEDAIHAAWSAEVLTEHGRRSEVWTAYSKDHGKTWSPAHKVFSRPVTGVTFDLFQSGETLGCVWTEKAQPRGGGALLVKTFRRGSRIVEEEARTLLEADDRETYFQDMRLVSSDGPTAVLVAEHSAFKPGRVWFFVRQAEDAEWLRSVVSQPKENMDAGGPIAVFESDRSVYTVAFHEVRKRRFLSEPTIWNCDLLLTQLKVEPNAGTAR